MRAITSRMPALSGDPRPELSYHFRVWQILQAECQHLAMYSAELKGIAWSI